MCEISCSRKLSLEDEVAELEAWCNYERHVPAHAQVVGIDPVILLRLIADWQKRGERIKELDKRICGYVRRDSEVFNSGDGSYKP